MGNKVKQNLIGLTPGSMVQLKESLDGYLEYGNLDYGNLDFNIMTGSRLYTIILDVLNKINIFYCSLKRPSLVEIPVVDIVF